MPNPVSHVAYGYATQMCILDRETGKIKKMVAAHDVGKAVNPLSVEGQIEGGVVMSMGYALTEQYPIDENCRPTAKYGMLGLFRANQLPQEEIEAIVVEKPGLDVAGGAIGIGEITSIPTAPAIADAYYRWDGERRFELPLANTPYARKKYKNNTGRSSAAACDETTYAGRYGFCPVRAFSALRVSTSVSWRAGTSYSSRTSS